MGREVVPSCADRASPVFEPEVDLAVRVQHRLALLAQNRLVLDQSHSFNLFERSVDRSYRHDDSSLGDLVAGPVVPRESKAVLVLSLVEVHLL